MKFLLSIFVLLVLVLTLTDKLCLAPDGYQIEFVVWKPYTRMSWGLWRVSDCEELVGRYEILIINF